MLGRSTSVASRLAQLGHAALAHPKAATRFLATAPALTKALNARTSAATVRVPAAAVAPAMASASAMLKPRVQLFHSLSSRAHARSPLASLLRPAPVAATSSASSAVSAAVAPVVAAPARAKSSGWGAGLEKNRKSLSDIEVAALESDATVDKIVIYEMPPTVVDKLKRHMYAAVGTAVLYPIAVSVMNSYIAYPYTIGVSLVGALLCLRQISNIFALQMAVKKMTVIWPSEDELAQDRAEDYEARAALNLRETESRNMYMVEMEARKEAAAAQEQALREGKSEEEAAALAREIVAQSTPMIEAESEEMSAMPSRLIIHRLGNPFSRSGSVIEVDPTKIKTRKLGPNAQVEIPLVPEDAAAAIAQDPRYAAMMLWADDTMPILFNAAHVKHIGAMNQLIQAANSNGVAEDLKVSPIGRRWNFAGQGASGARQAAAAASAGAAAPGAAAPGAAGAAPGSPAAPQQ